MVDLLEVDKNKHLWFKLCCYYQATTESYDRELTDMRSPHDETEAYIIGENRKWSTAYSSEQYRNIMDIAAKLMIPESIIKENGMSCGCRFSAQGWIDQYEYLVSIGEMDFINNVYNKEIVWKKLF